MARSKGQHIRRGLVTGALILAACAALEWVVLFTKAPPVLSPGLVLDLVWNVLLYAVIGGIVGLLAGVLVAFVTRSSSSDVLEHAPWALVMAGVLALYWIFAVNRLYPGSSREPVALALSVGAVLAAAIVGLILLVRGGRWKSLAVASLLMSEWV